MKTVMAPFRTLAAVTKLQALISRAGARISQKIRLGCRTRFREFTQLQKPTMRTRLYILRLVHVELRAFLKYSQ